jgi:hypothetical protein
MYGEFNFRFQILDFKFFQSAICNLQSEMGLR